MTFGVVKTEFQNSKQSLTTERLMLGNINGLKREDFHFLLNKSLENALKTVLNIPGWEKS